MERPNGNGQSWVRRVLVAADGSPASQVGLEAVADLAQRIGASVTVAYVRHVPAVAAMGGVSVSAQTLVSTLQEQETDVREQAARILGSTETSWDLVVLEGNPGDELVKLADERGADLVVVGSNRHSTVHNLVLGSTAAYLTAHSPVPVLVMRERAAKAPATSEQ